MDLRKLRAVDLYRSIPKDLTEATQLGGIVSVVCVVTLLILFLMELSTFFSITPVTRIEISHGEDESFRVNFNITFPEMSCEWISVDILDAIGHKKVNITDNSVHKYNLHGTWVASAVKNYDEVKYGSTDVEVYKNKRYTVPLTTLNFDRVVKEYRTILVNFHAPWCHHCQALKPIYEHAAEIVQQAQLEKYRNKAGGVAGKNYWQRDIALATVDCTQEVNVQLCQREHIQAFPTVRIFREGTDRKQGLHETYHGDRSAEEIANFAVKVLSEVQNKQAALPSGHGLDYDGDGDLDSQVHTRGCRVEGHIRVSRVPGSVIFSPHAEGHDFNVEAINVSHVIEHLSFGHKQFLGAVPRKYKSKLPKDFGGVFASDARDHSELFVSNKEHVTHEHYLKVVPTAFEPLNGKPIETYEYTINSNTYEKDKTVPTIKIMYDLSPMQVVVKETRRPLIDGLCGMCAILGGVYTSFMLVEGLLQGALRTYKKQGEGKLS